MCKATDIPLLVMDVEGTDGRERGEDQVGFPMYMFTLLTKSQGLREKVSTLLLGCVVCPPHKHVGAPGRSVPGRQHGPPQDRHGGKLLYVYRKLASKVGLAL